MPTSQTIAAIASPPGIGAVALIRISGSEALDLARKLFSPLPDSPRPRFQYFGKCLDADGSTIDEVLLTYFQGPKSFTGEDVIEIACHGGTVVTQSLLERIYTLGATPAEPGEFSQRAFFNGKIDLTQAEAIMDLISAQTELAVKAAGQQLAGKLGDEMEKLRIELIEVMAHVEAYIDFPDEDIDPESQELITGRIKNVTNKIDRLLSTADRGRILREGIRTVLCGAPNAGKSSLLNRLVGYDRAIVNSRPGTTRDTIEETIALDGIPLRMIDTAGIRESEDDIEKEGIERSRKQVEAAELILILIDSTESPAVYREIEEMVHCTVQCTQQCTEDEGTVYRPKVVRIFNKTDLPTHPDWETEETNDLIAVSCETGEGIDRLHDKILETVTGSESGFQTSDLVAINTRHQHFLKQARSFLDDSLARLEAGESPEFVSFEIREALEAIGAVVGKTDVEEILGSIFSTFCIGK